MGIKHKTYNEDDLQKLSNGELDIKEVCEKYGRNERQVKDVMRYRGLKVPSRLIKIETPYQVKIVSSVEEASDTLKVSDTTVRQALNGKRIKLFEELEIVLTECESKNYDKAWFRKSEN